MFIRIRTIKGRQYRYLQWSVREGKKVRTKSIYLGPVLGVGSFISANFKVEKGSVNWARTIEQAQKWAEEAKQQGVRKGQEEQCVSQPPGQADTAADLAAEQGPSAAEN